MSFATLLAELAGVDVEEARHRDEAHDDHSAVAESFSDLIDRKRNLVDRVRANEETNLIERGRNELQDRAGSRTEEVKTVIKKVEDNPTRKPAPRRFPQGNAPRRDLDEGLDM